MGCKRILIADDEPEMVSVLAEYLTQAGFEIRGVHSANDVIDCMRSWEPDLVLTDVEMPGGGAPRILDFMDEYDSPMPVLLMTGERRSWARSAVAEGRASAVLEKPFSMRAVVNAITAVHGLRDH